MIESKELRQRVLIFVKSDGDLKREDVTRAWPVEPMVNRAKNTHKARYVLRYYQQSKQYRVFDVPRCLRARESDKRYVKAEAQRADFVTTSEDAAITWAVMMRGRDVSWNGMRGQSAQRAKGDD